MTNKSKKIHDKLVENFIPQLRASKFFQAQFLSSLRRCSDYLGDNKIKQVICYGLGSFHNGYEVATRYQLALLLLIYEHLIELGHPLAEKIEVFDPSFEQLDTETLSCFSRPSFKILEENEYCARKFEFTNLVFMPHLDKYLYNNLLGANWSVINLSKVVLLGNSFQDMIDSEIKSKRRTELYYMDLLVRNFVDEISTTPTRKKVKSSTKLERQGDFLDDKVLIEIPIDDSTFEHLDVFNNMAFHLTNDAWLRENPRKLHQSCLKDWNPKIQQQEDVDWPD